MIAPYACETILLGKLLAPFDASLRKFPSRVHNSGPYLTSCRGIMKRLSTVHMDLPRTLLHVSRISGPLPCHAGFPNPSLPTSTYRHEGCLSCRSLLRQVTMAASEQLRAVHCSTDASEPLLLQARVVRGATTNRTWSQRLQPMWLGAQSMRRRRIFLHCMRVAQDEDRGIDEV